MRGPGRGGSTTPPDSDPAPHPQRKGTTVDPTTTAAGTAMIVAAGPITIALVVLGAWLDRHR